jgi:ATP-dependent helicase/nuclease subunit A
MPYDFDADYLGTEDRCLRVFQAEQFVPVEKNQSASQVRKSQPLPQWAWKIIEKDHYPPRILSPSKMEGQDIPVRSPISYNDETYRFRRGLLTHALLQYLPDIPLKNRESAASDYLLRQAPDISETLRQEIAEEVFEILTNEKFSSFFGEGSLAEVPVTGMVENKNGRKDIISGQIDRLLVDGDTVWIIDFKSNRPPPTQEHDVPLQYKNQLRAYKTLMQDVYPAHNIRCALLWTDGPFMTELKDL